jgi:hypothetical protein
MSDINSDTYPESYTDVFMHDYAGDDNLTVKHILKGKRVRIAVGYWRFIDIIPSSLFNKLGFDSITEPHLCRDCKDIILNAIHEAILSRYEKVSEK